MATTHKLERGPHRIRDRRTGRYDASPLCDGCNEPVGTGYYTDGAVCGGTDGPGFFLCERARCLRSLEGLSVEARRAIYTSNRGARP